MGWIILPLLMSVFQAEDSIFGLGVQGSFDGAFLYNYSDPYLYILDWGYGNPASSHGMEGAVINPAGLVSVNVASGSVAAGFGRKGGLEENLTFELPALGKVTIPVSVHSSEASGVYFGGAAVRIHDLVTGIAYSQGERLQAEIVSQGELYFTGQYSFADTIPEIDTLDAMPVFVDLQGEGGGKFFVDSRSRIRSLPFYLFFATEIDGINYGVSFHWKNYYGWINYTDSLAPLLRPTGIDVYTEAQGWDIDVSVSAQIEPGQGYYHSHVSRVSGNELGTTFGIQKPGDDFSWGGALALNLGANLLRNRIGSSRTGGGLLITEINTHNVVVDEEAKTITGDIGLVFGYEGQQEAEIDTNEILKLAPQTILRGGIQATPGNWIMDATLTLAKAWGQGSTKVLLGTGLGYDWIVPLRFTQVLYYRVTKIEEFPIYSVPALFLGVSTTLEWKGIELDLSLRTNTTTSFLTNTAASMDPDVPNLGILNHLSAGANLSYGF